MQGTVYFNASIFNILPNSDIKYFAKSNYMEIVLNEKFYKHKILFHNYLTNGTQNYQLKMENITLSPSIPGHIDKQQWYIKGELLAQDNNIISSLNFIRNKLNSLVESKHYYLNTLITINTQNIDKSLNFYYGSNISDTFLIKNNTYIEGQEGSDYYIIYGKNHLHDGIVIDNTSYDQALDFLIIQEEDAQFYLKEDNVDLHINVKNAYSNYTIVIKYYFTNHGKHLVIKNHNSLPKIPFIDSRNITLIPLYEIYNEQYIHQIDITKIDKIALYNPLSIKTYAIESSLLILATFRDQENISPLCLFLDGYNKAAIIQPNFRVYNYTTDILYQNYTDLTQLLNQAVKLNINEISKKVNKLIIDKDTDFFGNRTIEQLIEQNKVGLLRYTNNELFQDIEVINFGKDLTLFNNNTNCYNLIKDYNTEHNKWHVFEFYTHHIPPIFIYPSVDIGFFIKFSEAKLIAQYYNELNSIDCYNENIVRCIYSLYSMGIKDSYILLGFSSLLHQATFNTACYFEKEAVQKLMTCKYFNNILDRYNNILSRTISLIALNPEESLRYAKILDKIVIEHNLGEDILQKL
ncbi:hypothetical protein NOVO_03220 [Rickettsiales bacterium Ac37b]|nr:hypothetical protein NOVO_03220 [Rickettsiales bacterium Ac37b]